MPTYSFNWLAEKSENCEDYIKIHNEWAEAGYPKHLSPSYDRIDNSKPYTEDNIKITTWEKNEARSRIDMRNCVIINNTNPQRAVGQYSEDDVFIKKHTSLQNASRDTGVPAGNICRHTLLWSGAKQ